MTELKILKTDTISIDSVKPWAKNPRDITEENLEGLKNRISKLGLMRPFIIWQEQNVILGGNQRYKACKELGIDKIWVVYVSCKDDAEAFEVMLIDNEQSGYYVQEELKSLYNLYQDKIKFEDIRITNETISLKDYMLPDVAPKDPQETEFKTIIRVFVDCVDETMQEKVFNDLSELGYEPKVINV